MSMKGGFLMMAMAMAICTDPVMRGSSRSSYEPNIPPKKRILPGKFKGAIPKGCKIQTVKISVDWDNVTLVKEVDIIFGSEKSKQKSLIKAEAQIHEWLYYTTLSRQQTLNNFDEVIVRSIQNCPFMACDINEKGYCISTNTMQCKSIPPQFNADRE